jgi:hypothetical protein
VSQPSSSAAASSASGSASAAGGGGRTAGAAASPGTGSSAGAGAAGATTAAPGQQTSAAKTSTAPTKAATSTSAGTPNKYTAAEACGSGFSVVDHHALTGATIYLLYNNSTGYNCVVTLATYVKGAVSMNATLTVQGGSSASDPGSWTYYAGPVTEHAPSSCVEWGGTYKGSSWTSGWSHCG